MPDNPSPTATIVKAGLVAGTLDISAAILDYYISTGRNPLGLLKFVASGVFGEAAFTGNWTMAAWGLLFHFLIALVFAAIFFVMWPFINKIVTSPVIAGLLYGLVVWAIMNQLVLPLSQAPALPFSWPKTFKAMAILMVCIGLPVSIIVSRYYHSRTVMPAYQTHTATG